MTEEKGDTIANFMSAKKKQSHKPITNKNGKIIFTSQEKTNDILKYGLIRERPT